MALTGSCAKCGQSHPRCTGHATDEDTGEKRPCRQWPRHGQDVCKTHGGSSPQALAAAERRRAEADVDKTLARIGPIQPTSVRNVYERLLALAGLIDGWVLILTAKVENLTSIGDAEGRIRPEVQVFERAVRMLGDLLVAIGRLDLEERIARMDRADMQAMADLFDRSLAMAGLTPAVQQSVREAFAGLAAQLTGGDGS